MSTRTACLYVLLWFFISSCANIVPPQGGERDEQAPQVITDLSTPSEQTNFRPERIELTFDEWVRLQDQNQIVVSPPLQQGIDYEVYMKGKTLRVDFKQPDSLLTDVTYVINFGESIVDLTERNPAENLTYVFSTGPFIDSLQLSGQLVSAVDNKPIPKALFMLYRNLADSVVYTQEPFYFARSDSSGRFQVNNIKAGTYKGFALAAEGINRKYGRNGEAIGFPDAPIEITAAGNPSLLIRMTPEVLAPQIVDERLKTYGRAVIGFNQPPDSIRLEYDTTDRVVLREQKRDSLILWYQQADEDSWAVVVSGDTSLRDTLIVKPSRRAEFLANSQLSIKGGGKGRRIFGPDEFLTFEGSAPLVEWDTSRIVFLADSLRSTAYRIVKDSVNPRMVHFYPPWREKQSYDLTLLDGALTDIFGRSQKDTLTAQMAGAELSSFGNLFINFTEADSTQSYYVELIGRQDKVLRRWSLNGQSSYRKEVPNLTPGSYVMRIVFDDNANGKWDPVSYPTRRQAERQRRRPLEQLRANWDLEAEVSLSSDLEASDE